jgi:hypothetical protein
VLVGYDMNEYELRLEECGGQFTVLTDHDDWGNLSLPIVNLGGGGGPLPPVLGADCPPVTP